jgi:hypothetical protein
MSDDRQRLVVDLPTDALHTIFSSHRRARVIERPGGLALAPREVYIGELE